MVLSLKNPKMSFEILSLPYEQYAKLGWLMSKKENTNHIGLEQGKTVVTIQRLNVLLACYQVFNMNVRGYHWNIKGEQFFELHARFEEIYNDLQEKIDEIAERVLTLGSEPVHAFTQYLYLSEIPEHISVSGSKDTMAGVALSYQTLIAEQRDIMEWAADLGDEGTAALMSDYIREQEKSLWQYTAYLEID